MIDRAIKLFGALLAVIGGILIAVAAYYPPTTLYMGNIITFQEIGDNVIILFGGLISLVSGALIVWREDPELGEKVMEYIGKIMNLI